MLEVTPRNHERSRRPRAPCEPWSTLASRVLYRKAKPAASHQVPNAEVVVMSPSANEKPQPQSFQVDEEKWFCDYGRERKRPLRQSPTTPPPPIGDELADGWFR